VKGFWEGPGLGFGFESIIEGFVSCNGKRFGKEVCVFLGLVE
jgi:hypothetical protein